VRTLYKNVGRKFFHFVTIHAFNRQTDGQNLIANTASA